MSVVAASLRSLLESVAVLVLLSSLVFVALRLLPGDPAMLVLGEQAAEAELAALRHTLHLDVPMPVQYAIFLKGLFTLDLGDSLRRPGIPAFVRVAQSLGSTAALASAAVVSGTLFGIVSAILGVGPWLGARRRWVAKALDGVAATPLLSFAPLALYVLSVRWQWVPLPADPDAGASGLLFAGALLAIPLGAHTGRVALAALEQIAHAPFLRVAAAKGATPLRVWTRHALPTVLGPIITVVATQLGALLGGAVVVERLFERPGLGLLFLEAYATRDLPVLEAVVVASGALFVCAQAFGTWVHAAVDPRVAESQSQGSA
jgi:peptide/nickel transport system permease protein